MGRIIRRLSFMANFPLTFQHLLHLSSMEREIIERTDGFKRSEYSRYFEAVNASTWCSSVSRWVINFLKLCFVSDSSTSKRRGGVGGPNPHNITASVRQSGHHVHKQRWKYNFHSNKT